jgi:hypothetical protein
VTSHAQIYTTRISLAAAGALLGGGFGYAVGHLMKSSSIRLGDLAWSDLVAMTLGASLIGIGAIAAAATVVRKLRATIIEPTAGRPMTPAIARFYRLQALVLVLAGVMLLLPVAGLVRDAGASVRMELFALVVLMFGLQTYGNLLIWRRSDEFLRKIIADTGAVCFWVLQGALFLWAAGEHLSLLPRLSSWDAVAILMLVYSVASVSISLRRVAS